METVIRGMLCGLAGTATMTALIATEKMLGLMREKPAPEIISANVEQAIGLRDHLPEPLFQLSWLLQHTGYGLTAGVGYALLRRLRRAGNPVLSGSLYGIGLYLIGYAGWLPLLNLYPPPARNPRRKVAMLLMEHIIFGTTAALTCGTLEAPSA